MTLEIYLDDVSSTFMTSEFYLNVRDLPWWREFYLNDVSSTLMTSVMDLLNSWRRPAISNAAPHRPEGRRPKWIQSFFIRDTETKIKYISPSPFLSVTTNWSNIKLHRLVVVKFIYSWLTKSIETIYRDKATNYPCPSYPVGTFPLLNTETESNSGNWSCLWGTRGPGKRTELVIEEKIIYRDDAHSKHAFKKKLT